MKHIQNGKRKFLLGSVLALMSLWHPQTQAIDTGTEYTFDRMWPPLAQPWNFQTPSSIATAPDGSLWVADLQGYQFQHLKVDGGIIGQFGYSLDSRSYGGFPVAAYPDDSIAVAADGSVWKGSRSGKVAHYSADGGLITQFMAEPTLPGSSYQGSWNQTGAAVAKDGSVWITQSQVGTVQHFNAEGKLLSQFDNTCSDIIQGVNVRGYAHATDGTRWAVKGDDGISLEHLRSDGSINNGYSIQHLNVDGSIILEFGKPENGPGYFNNIQDLKLAEDGSVWVWDIVDQGGQFHPRLQHYTNNGNFIVQIITSEIDWTSDFAIANDGSVWVVNGANTSLRHFSSDGHLIRQIGNSTIDAVQFMQPNNIVVAKDSSLWVADNGNHRIQHFTSEGNLIAQFGSEGFDPGKLGSNFQVQLAADDGVWTSEFSNAYLRPTRFQHFSVEGAYIETIISSDSSWCSGSGVGQFNRPHDIALAIDGSIWVVDTNNNRIQHFNSNGTLIISFGSFGRDPGQFIKPQSIALAPDGSVWVADTFNERIQHYNADGSFIAQFGSHGSAVGQFFTPSDLALSTDGSLWVVDSGNRRIQHLSSDGRFIEQIGRYNQDNQIESAFDFYSQTDIALAEDGSPWVGNINCSNGNCSCNNGGCLTYGPNVFHFNTEAGLIGSFDNEKGVAAFVPSITKVANDGSVWKAGSGDVIQRVSADDGVIANVGIGAVSELIETVVDGSVWVKSTVPAPRGGQGYVRLEHFSAAGDLTAEVRGVTGNFAVEPDGSVWVVIENQVRHYGKDGQLIEQFGAAGAGPGQFNRPTRIARTKDGTLWVLDSGNHRIQKFVRQAVATRPVEYDAQQKILYLHDVTVGMGLHFDVTLKQQIDRFVLQDAKFADKRYFSAANYDPSNNVLTIPLGKAFGQDYQAVLKNLGNYVFGLATATPLAQ